MSQCTLLASDDRFLRLRSVEQLIDAGKSVIYGPGFPKPIKLSARYAVWTESSVRDWMRRRVEAAVAREAA